MNRQALLGAFVLGGLGLLTAAFVLFGNLHPFSRTDHAVLIFRGSTSGLSIGAAVNFRGVQVGAVDRIAIEYEPKTRQAYIPVYITLRRDSVILANKHDGRLPSLAELVADGLRAEMNLKSFVTGTSQIDLDMSPQTPAILHPDVATVTEIPTRESPIQAMTNTLTHLPLQQLSENASQALKTVRHLAETLDHDLPGLAASVKETSDHSRAAIDAAHEMITELQPQLKQTLQSIDRLASSGANQIDARGREVSTLIRISGTTMTTANATLQNLQGMTSPRSIDRANLDASLRDIAATASSLRGFANDLERNPQLLLTGRHS